MNLIERAMDAVDGLRYKVDTLRHGQPLMAWEYEDEISQAERAIWEKYGSDFTFYKTNYDSEWAIGLHREGVRVAARMGFGTTKNPAPRGADFVQRAIAVADSLFARAKEARALT